VTQKVSVLGILSEFHSIQKAKSLPVSAGRRMGVGTGISLQCSCRSSAKLMQMVGFIRIGV